MVPLREDSFDSHSWGCLENQGFVDLVFCVQPFVDLLDMVLMAREEGTRKVVIHGDFAGTEWKDKYSI
jgi:hypothetical protein